MPELTLTNAAGRDAQVAAEPVRIPIRIRRLDRDGRQCQSVRILKGTLHTGFGALFAKAPDGHGDVIANSLIAGDPELDIETIGTFLRPGDTKRVYVDPAGQVLHAVTQLEIVHNPDGTEKARRPHQLQGANIGAPFRWSGKFISRAEAAHKFVFGSKRQIQHVNGITFDFLYAIARDLEERDSLLVVGSGPKGTGPLILRRGALPYRGFLEGRTRGDSEYLLILHLSNMELKAVGSGQKAEGSQKQEAAA